MRYHTTKPELYFEIYGETYICDHPVYKRCTLYKNGTIGLAVIQQRYLPEIKATYWSEIDPWLTDQIYLNPNFIKFFNERAGAMVEGLYPTVTVRQIMWALKMKPIKKERWETVFDRKEI